VVAADAPGASPAFSCIRIFAGSASPTPTTRVGRRSREPLLKWLKLKQPHYREGERGWER